jgi:hypothetical protein
MQLWEAASIIHEQLHLVHLRFFTSLPDDSRIGFFAHNEEAVIIRSLRSDRPSQFLMGLRQFERVVTIDNPRAVRLMRHLSQAAIEKFERYAPIDDAVASVVRILTALVVNPTYAAIHPAVHAALASTARYPPSAAYLCEALAWLPTVIREGTNADAIIGEVKLFMRIHSPHIFALAAAVLTEQITAASPARRDELAMNAYFTFLNEHAEHQSYFTTLYLQGFAGIFQTLDKDTLFHFCVNSAKALRFLPVFLCVTEVVRDLEDAGWTQALALALSGIVEGAAHQRALEIMMGSGITREAIELACGP